MLDSETKKRLIEQTRMVRTSKRGKSRPGDYDATGRRTPEDAVEHKEGLYRALFDGSRDAIFLTAADAGFVEVNEAASVLTGYSREELRRMTIPDLHEVEDMQAYEQFFGRIMSGEQITSEAKILRKDGTKVDAEFSNRRIMIGDTAYMHTTARDITQRKQAEETLRESEERLSAIAEKSPIPTAVGGSDGSIISFNEALEELTGYRRTEIADVTDWANKLYPDQEYRDFVWKNIQQALGGEKQDCTVFTIARKDGSTRTVDFHTSFYKDGLIIQMVDITEREKAEEALRESESRFRSLSEAAFEGVVFSENGVLVDANEAFARMYRRSLGELIGRPVMELVAPEHRELVAENIRSGYEGAYEHKGIREDGSLIDLEIQGRTVTYRGRKMRMTALRDITKRKQVELALQESEERLKILFESAPDGIYLNDLNGNFVDGNKAAEELVGYAREELIGKNFAEAGLLSPEDTERAAARLQKTAAGEPVGPEEFTLIRKDGSKIEVEISTFPAAIKGQIFSLGVARDITDRKCSEEALQESEFYLRKSQEVSNTGSYVYDIVNDSLTASDVLNDIWGIHDDIKKDAKRWVSILHPDDREEMTDYLLDHVIGCGNAFDKEYRLINQETKETVWVHGRGELELDDSGAPIKMVGTIVDITERKQAEEALRASEERHRNMIELSPDVIVVVNKRGVIVSCNSAVENTSGYAKEDIVGKHFTKLGILRLKDIPKYVKIFAQTVKGDLPEPFEVDFTKKDGSRAMAEVRISLLEDGNIQAIVTDITDRKRAQRKLVEYSEQLKSLASQLSLTEERERHRLATLLHDHIGQSLVFSKLKLDQIRKSVSSEELAEAMDEVCNWIGNVIADTRTLTFDLSWPILYEMGFEAAVAEWLNDEIEQKHAIKTEFEDDGQHKPLSADIQAVLFRNVRELLVNVVKHAQAQNVKVSIHRVDGDIRIGVEDDGVGFDPVDVTSRAAKRAEFGLFSIRQRLEQLGGILEIASEPGRGARILMTAPFKEPQTDNAPQSV